MADVATQYTLSTGAGTINFNAGDLSDGTDKYWITAIQGLDGPEVRAPTDPVPFGDGGLKHTWWFGPRRVIFDGMLLIEDPRDCMERRNDLAFALQNALISITNTAGTLSWTPAGQSAMSLSVYNEVKLNVTYTDNYTVSNFSFGLWSEAASPT